MKKPGITLLAGTLALCLSTVSPSGAAVPVSSSTGAFAVTQSLLIRPANNYLCRTTPWIYLVCRH